MIYVIQTNVNTVSMENDPFLQFLNLFKVDTTKIMRLLADPAPQHWF
jgi:hypothetical protein